MSYMNNFHFVLYLLIMAVSASEFTFVRRARNAVKLLRKVGLKYVLEYIRSVVRANRFLQHHGDSEIEAFCMYFLQCDLEGR